MSETIYRDQLIERAAALSGVSIFRAKEIILSYISLIETETRLKGYSRFLKVCTFRPTGSPRSQVDPLRSQLKTLAVRGGFSEGEVESVLLHLNDLVSFEVSRGNVVVVTSLVKIQPDLQKEKVYFFKAEAFGNDFSKPIRVVRDPRFLRSLS